MNILLMFEQSGTFKRLLQQAGHTATDADIDNYFRQTDIQTDLFDDILSNRIEYKQYDLIIAFFPCTWFSRQNELLINGSSYSMRNWTKEKKKQYSLNRLAEREKAATVLKTLVTLCHCYDVPLIIENPAGDYIKSILGQPTIAHMRSQYGDDFQKITYWYLRGCEHDSSRLKKLTNSRHSTKHIEVLKHHSDKQRKIERSLISPVYAANLLHSIKVKGKYIL